jgi:hypothetical protein
MLVVMGSHLSSRQNCAVYHSIKDKGKTPDIISQIANGILRRDFDMAAHDGCLFLWRGVTAGRLLLFKQSRATISRPAMVRQAHHPAGYHINMIDM